MNLLDGSVGAGHKTMGVGLVLRDHTMFPYCSKLDNWHNLNNVCTFVNLLIIMKIYLFTLIFILTKDGKCYINFRMRIGISKDAFENLS